jgi:uncharacterized protein YukE
VSPRADDAGPGAVADYTLDVDPDAVDAAARQLRLVVDELDAVRDGARRVGADLPSVWQGRAADAITTELAGLRRQTDAAARDLDVAAAALETFSRHLTAAVADAAYLARRDAAAVADQVTTGRRARSQHADTLAGLSWPAGAPDRASARDDADAVLSRQLADAAAALAADRGRLAGEMADIRERLAAAAHTAGTVLGDAAPAASPDATTRSCRPDDPAHDLPLTRQRFALLAQGQPDDPGSPDFWTPTASAFVDPFSDEFGAAPLGVAQSLLVSYGRGVQLYLPGSEVVATRTLLDIPGFEGRSAVLLDRSFSLQTSGEGLRTSPVNAPAWMQRSGKALGAAGVGLTLFASGRDQWELDAQRYPTMSETERVARTVEHTAVVGGASAAGGWYLAGQGAMWGAAACSATGVGVTVAWACGAVGGIVGGFIGSKAGAAVGGAVEDLGKSVWHGLFG